MRKTQWIIGIDEVGRGPLAGPITVAAVAAPISNLQFSISNKFPINQFLNLTGIRDSKKLSPVQREKWGKIIRKDFSYSTRSVSSKIIDKKGIAYAARIAVSSCLKKILPTLKIKNCKLEIVLDGGLYAPLKYKNQQTIIKGDENHPLIAAASIVAKVHRDRYMTRLHKELPQYGFAYHKGYGTQMHCVMLKKHGLSAAHRASFCKGLEV